jgi:hypothetical protein
LIRHKQNSELRGESEAKRKRRKLMNEEGKKEKREYNKKLFEAEKCSDPLGFL